MSGDRRGRRVRRVFGLVILPALLAVPAAQASIYWSQEDGDGSIGRANLDRSDKRPALIAGTSDPAGIGIRGGYLYWSDNGSNRIGRANLDGTGVKLPFISTNQPRGLAVDAGHLYWGNGGGATTFSRANIDGTGTQSNFITGVTGPHEIAVDGAHVFWTDNGSAFGRLAGTSLAGTVPPGLVININGPGGVALDAAHVYWANVNDGTIGRANLDGTGVKQDFITGGSTPQGVAVDSTHIYWANRNSGTIGRANIDGSGKDQSFITGVGLPIGVTLTPLETTITGGPTGTSSRDVTFSFAASEPAGFDCRLDAGAFTPCGSPKAYGGLKSGPHTFTVRAHNSVGSLDPTPATRSWVVDGTAPRVRGLSLKASRIRYRLNEAATVAFGVEQIGAGHKVKGKCRKRTRANRRRPRCALPLKGSFKQRGKAGKNSLKFRGRLRGRALKPGRYYLVVRATDGFGNKATARRLKFKIARRR